MRPETSLHSSRNLGWSDLLVDHRQHHRTDEIVYPGGVLEHAVICRTGNGSKAWQAIGTRMKCHVFQRGSITIVPARQPCSWRWRDQEGRSMVLGLRPQFLQKVALESCDLEPAYVELVPRADIRDPHIEWIAARLLDEVVQAGPGGRVYAESLAQVLAIHLLRNYAVATARPGKAHGLPRATLQRLADYLRANLAENITLAELAAVAGLSSFHFARSFRKATGLAPHQYLIRLRVERARELLQQKQADKSLAAVAAEVGFYDQSHLSRHFRRIVGVTPLRFQAGSKNIL
jgi:AraC family transcriptional regulator